MRKECVDILTKFVSQVSEGVEPTVPADDEIEDVVDIMMDEYNNAMDMSFSRSMDERDNIKNLIEMYINSIGYEIELQ